MAIKKIEEISPLFDSCLALQHLYLFTFLGKIWYSPVSQEVMRRG
jgi:hypothetical protein